MILVDSSIWVDHLRRADPTLFALLDRVQVLSHPFVVGEIALEHLKNRIRVLAYLRNLPQAKPATDHEVLLTIDRNALAGEGIGYVDAHLLAAVQLTPGASFWTRDKRLAAIATRLGLTAPV